MAEICGLAVWEMTVAREYCGGKVEVSSLGA